MSPKASENANMVYSNQRLPAYQRFSAYIASSGGDHHEDDKVNTVGYPHGSIRSVDAGPRTRNDDMAHSAGGGTELHRSGNDQNPKPLALAEAGANSQIVMGTVPARERTDSQITMFIRGKSARRIRMRMSEEKFR